MGAVLKWRRRVGPTQVEHIGLRASVDITWMAPRHIIRAVLSNRKVCWVIQGISVGDLRTIVHYLVRVMWSLLRHGTLWEEKQAPAQ